MIQVDQLTKHYGPVTAIQDVSFGVDKGQIVGFLGPNGAGKSTTMKILSCFMPASSGTAPRGGLRRLLPVPRGAAAHRLPARERAPLRGHARGGVPRLRGRDQGRVARGARRGRVADVMDRCFISDVQQPADRQAVQGLPAARRPRPGARSATPRCSSSTSRPSASTRRQIAEIRALIRSLAGQHTVILSTHILPEVSMVCDGVIIINRGRIVAQGTESELVEQVFPTARVELRRGRRDGRRGAGAARRPARARRGGAAVARRGRRLHRRVPARPRRPRRSRGSW